MLPFSCFHFLLFCIIPLVLAQDVWIEWKNSPPDNIPFDKSTDIVSWEYLNNSNFIYGGAFLSADTWYPTWALNGKLYTPFTDGTVYLSNGMNISAGSRGYGPNLDSTAGFATVVGNDAESLDIVSASTMTASTYPYGGRYPCGSFAYNDTIFYGTYMLNSSNIQCGGGEWCQMGPFVGFRWSTNYGASWTEPRVKCKDFEDNIFHETIENNGKIKFGGPHCVDFGQNLQYSPDHKMYFVGFGASRSNAIQTWIQGDEVYLARVSPTIKAVNDSDEWEFYGGKIMNDTRDVWIKGNVTAAKPLFTWINRTGVVTMTYFNVLKKYITAITMPTNGYMTDAQFDTYFLESDNLTGPFKYIVYLTQFGPEAYFVSHPSKFLGETINNSYYYSYLSYSANYHLDHGQQGIPIGSGYHWSLQKARFKLSKSFDNKLKHKPS